MPKLQTPYKNQWKFVLDRHRKQVKEWAKANKERRKAAVAKAKKQDGK